MSREKRSFSEKSKQSLNAAQIQFKIVSDKYAIAKKLLTKLKTYGDKIDKGIAKRKNSLQNWESSIYKLGNQIEQNFGKTYQQHAAIFKLRKQFDKDLTQLIELQKKSNSSQRKQVKMEIKQMQQQFEQQLKPLQLTYKKMFGQILSSLAQIETVNRLILNNYLQLNYDKFQAKTMSDRVKITFLGNKDDDGGSAYQNYILKGEIPQKTTSLRTIKKVSGNSIRIGIATDAIFGLKDAFENKQSITYTSGSGNIWRNGNVQARGRSLNEGEVISLSVDLINWQVQWYVKQAHKPNQLLGKVQVTKQIRHKQLYFVIMMRTQNDTIEWLH